MSLVWQVHAADTWVSLRDLPVGTLERVDAAWSMLLVAPLADLDCALRLVDAVHAHVGAATPDGLTPRTIATMFRTVDDDMPDVWIDGVPDQPLRHLDGWVVTLCRPPYNFTPRQVREDFTVRDLMLLRDAAEARSDD